MADDQRKRGWVWLVPSLSHWVWLVFFVVLLTPEWRTALVSADGDACMHWAVGEHMLQTRQIVRADTFSHTRAGAPIVSKEWLAEILYAVAGRVAGLDGLAILAALVIATTFALLHWQLAREGADLLVATAVTILTAWAATSHWLARPHVFSFLMLLLWHAAIRQPGRWLPARLAALAALWVNLHGAFLAGFFVLGAYWLGALLERNEPLLRRLTSAGAAAALATLLNPSGYRLHLHNIEFLRSEFFAGYLAEYASTNFQSPAGHSFLVWLAVLFFVLALARPRLRAGEIVLLLTWGYFALYAGRNVALLAILSAPLVARGVTVAGRWAELSARLRTLDDRARGWPVVAALAVAGLCTWPDTARMPPEKWPVAAVAHIRQHPDAFTGNMLNQYAWGGYLMVALPEHKTFVDGRADFYGEDLVKEFQLATALRPGWRAPLDKYTVQWTLMPTGHRLNLALAAWGDWEPIYRDEVATIYRRRL